MNVLNTVINGPGALTSHALLLRLQCKGHDAALMHSPACKGRYCTRKPC